MKNSCVPTSKKYLGRNNFSYEIRTIQQNDKEKLLSFFNKLSPESRYLRFAHAISKLSNLFMEDVLDLDYKKEMAFVAYFLNDSNTEEIIGISRYVSINESSCEFSISLADAYTKQGIGKNLMHHLINHASNQGLKTMIGYVLKINSKMLSFIKKIGFKENQDQSNPEFLLVSLKIN